MVSVLAGLYRLELGDKMGFFCFTDLAVSVPSILPTCVISVGMTSLVVWRDGCWSQKSSGDGYSADKRKNRNYPRRYLFALHFSSPEMS